MRMRRKQGIYKESSISGGFGGLMVGSRFTFAPIPCIQYVCCAGLVAHHSNHMILRIAYHYLCFSSMFIFFHCTLQDGHQGFHYSFSKVLFGQLTVLITVGQLELVEAESCRKYRVSCADIKAKGARR